MGVSEEEKAEYERGDRIYEAEKELKTAAALIAGGLSGIQVSITKTGNAGIDGATARLESGIAQALCVFARLTAR